MWEWRKWREEWVEGGESEGGERGREVAKVVSGVGEGGEGEAVEGGGRLWGAVKVVRGVGRGRGG